MAAHCVIRGGRSGVIHLSALIFLPSPTVEKTRQEKICRANERIQAQGSARRRKEAKSFPAGHLSAKNRVYSPRVRATRTNGARAVCPREEGKRGRPFRAPIICARIRNLSPNVSSANNCTNLRSFCTYVHLRADACTCERQNPIFINGAQTAHNCT